MKNYFKTVFLALLFGGLFSGCSGEDTDTVLPPQYFPIYTETFGNLTDPEPFVFENWTMFTEAGSRNFEVDSYQGNYYIEFSSFGSNDSSNIGWAITPPINIDTATKKGFSFQSAQHHATSLDNKFEVLVSSDYDGTNVLGATWDKVTFRGPRYIGSTNYDMVASGGIDLSKYSGTIYIAFRVIGNGDNQTGGFQVDNINVF